MELLLIPVLFLAGGIIRRLNGGWQPLEKDIDKTLLEITFGLIAAATAYPSLGPASAILVLSGVVLFRPGHGSGIDLGTMPHTPNDSLSFVTEFLFPDRLKGSPLYDMTFLSIRYFIPALILCSTVAITVGSWGPLIYAPVGLTVGPLYMLAYKIKERIPHSDMFDGYTAVAEFLLGGTLLAGTLLFQVL